MNRTELGEHVSYPRTGLSLVPELMITQHNVLLMEMLFLGSILMIIIVTNLAWKPVSQDLYPLLHNNSVSCPETLPGTLFSLANLVPKLSQDVCLGKGSCGTLRTLRYSFYLFHQLVGKYIRSYLTSEVATLLPPSDVCVRSFFCHFHFK